jgi:glycosyltransferase involved in cell wall biosynthesis
MGWENRFTFLGHVNAPEQFFQQIDVLVTPSYHDSFGRTFMEGVCSGVPVLTSAAGAMTEVAEKLPLQKLLLFEEGNATALRAALEAFVNRNDFDVETYARQGRALFDLRRTVEEMNAFFRRAMEF